MKKRIGFGMIILICSILTVGCNYSLPGEDKVTEIHLKKDTAEQLDIDLQIDYGQVNISAGAENWVDGKIKYNFAKLEPKVSYKLSREKGKVTIDQPKKKRINFKKGNFTNNWDLQLTNDIPIDLNVNTGASDTNLDLKGSHLSNLVVDAGVGRTIIDLGGVWQESFDVNIEMGVGQTTVILPKEVGVKIKASKGIGSSNFSGFISQDDGVYHNEAYEHADVILTVHTDLGIGEVNFELED